MGAVVKVDVSDALGNPDGASTLMLGPRRERRLLEELADCKRTVAGALARDPGLVVPEKTDDPRAMSRFIAEVYRNHGPMEGTLEAVFQRYFELPRRTGPCQHSAGGPRRQAVSQSRRGLL